MLQNDRSINGGLPSSQCPRSLKLLLQYCYAHIIITLHLQIYINTRKPSHTQGSVFARSYSHIYLPKRIFTHKCVRAHTNTYAHKHIHTRARTHTKTHYFISTCVHARANTYVRPSNFNYSPLL